MRKNTTSGGAGDTGGPGAEHAGPHGSEAGFSAAFHTPLPLPVSKTSLRVQMRILFSSNVAKMKK